MLLIFCNKTFYKVYTLLSHTPHHTKSPLSSRGRDSHKRVRHSALSRLDIGNGTELSWRSVSMTLKMASQSTTGKIGDLYELKEELGK